MNLNAITKMLKSRKVVNNMQIVKANETVKIKKADKKRGKRT